MILSLMVLSRYCGEFLGLSLFNVLRKSVVHHLMSCFFKSSSIGLLISISSFSSRIRASFIVFAISSMSFGSMRKQFLRSSAAPVVLLRMSAPFGFVAMYSFETKFIPSAIEVTSKASPIE